MPELPEVESIAVELRASLVGQRIARQMSAVQVLWPRTVAYPDPAALAALLPGRSFASGGRRGKYLLLGLDSGDTLIVHLGMTGRLEVVSADNPAASGPHVRAWLELAGGQRLVFTDQRKFGRIWLVSDPESVVGKLGPEPLAWDFTPQRLGVRLENRRAAIKSVLLDQAVVAGLGNIYADESLFLASIHPLRPADSLLPDEIERLHAAIQRVLSEAINARGTTLRDYRPAYGAEGSYQYRLRVYAQTDRPCPRCGAPIRRIRVGQRSTHFCPRCQADPGGSSWEEDNDPTSTI